MPGLALTQLEELPCFMDKTLNQQLRLRSSAKDGDFFDSVAFQDALMKPWQLTKSDAVAGRWGSTLLT